MKLISWNVNGIRAVMKKEFMESLNSMAPDILCLQETKAQDEQVVETLKNINGFHIYINSAVKKGYSGTAILSKEEPLCITYGLGIEEHDHEGRVITAEYKEFYLVNAYVPNSQNELKRLDYRAQWDKDILTFLQKLDAKKPVVFCGDLNVAHTDKDIKNAKSNYNKSPGYTQTEIDGLSAFIEYGFVDTWRYFNPDEIKYSWWSYRFNSRAKNTGWRIDYFLTSKRLLEVISNTEIHNDVYGSDHCPVSININV